MTGIEMGIGECYGHKGRMTFDPATVVVILIDPETNLPPDIGPGGERITPTEEARARAVQHPLCDRCVQEVNRSRAAKGQPIVETSQTTRLWRP